MVGDSKLAETGPSFSSQCFIPVPSFLRRRGESVSIVSSSRGSTDDEYAVIVQMNLERLSHGVIVANERHG